jgi:hypothetical protein
MSGTRPKSAAASRKPQTNGVLTICFCQRGFSKSCNVFGTSPSFTRSVF